MASAKWTSDILMSIPTLPNSSPEGKAVYVRAEGSGKWSLISVLAEIKQLFLLLVRPQMEPVETLWFERCFNVENERLAYLFALKEQHLVSCVEQWHFVSFGSPRLSSAICLLLDFIGMLPAQRAEQHPISLQPQQHANVP